MTAPAPSLDAAAIEALGLRLGLSAVGIASAEPFAATRAELERRREEGLHGGMGFTYRRPERATDPERSLAGARSLVVGAVAYAPPAPSASASTPARPTGRVAAYSAPDGYEPLRAALQAIAARLKAEGHRARVLVDDNGLVDRAAAHRAGIGWYGKSANLLLVGRGSWFLLGSVLTTAALDPSRQPVADGCGTCRRCLDGCPTGAIVAPGVVDARRCLSWLLQAPGPFPEEHRAALGDRLYGCDECQEVCPPNRRLGAAATGDDRGRVDLLSVLEADGAELLERFGHWYLPDRDPRLVRRNALVVLGNVGSVDDPATVAAIARYRADPDPLLREHADWAAARLGLPPPGAARTSRRRPTLSGTSSEASRS